MGLRNSELLQKAAMTLSDFGGTDQAPLTIEQVQQFLRLAIQPQDLLPDVHTVMANANKWQESKVSFDKRVMRSGTELARLAPSDQTKPDTGIVEISTVLLRGEVPISDEVMEDQVERAGFGDTVMQMVAERAGTDIEELMIAGDSRPSGRANYNLHNEPAGAYMRLLDGWLVQALLETDANVLDASSDGQDYQRMFNKLITALPDRYKRDIGNMRFYVPRRLEEKYRDILAARGTPLGDKTLEGTQKLTYQGITIHGVANFPIHSPASGDDTSFILLTHKDNLYAGYRRQIKLETFRDPREGSTSFIPTARVDAKVAHVPATAVAHGVSVEA